MLRRVHPVALVVAALALAACGGNSHSASDVVADTHFGGDAPDGSADVSASYDFVDLCTRWAEACCHVLTCEGSSPAGEESLCVDAQKEVCDHDIGNLLGSHIDLGQVDYSAANAEACWAPIIAAACDELDVAHPPTVCGAIVFGAAGAGAACDFDAFCATGFFCKPGADGACPGTCAQRVADGETCDPSTALCLEGSRCLTTYNTGLDHPVCGAMNLAHGAACLADIQCASGGYCDAAGGTCAAQLSDAAPCTAASQCASGACTPDAHTCAAPPTTDQACEFVCAKGFVCLRESHVCVVGPTQAGDPCVDAAYFPCGLTAELQCDPASDKCVGPLPLNAACGGPNGPTLCAAGYCSGDFQTAGTCLAAKHVGDTCAYSNECGSFMTCRSDKTCGLYGDPCRGAPIDALW